MTYEDAARELAEHDPAIEAALKVFVDALNAAWVALVEGGFTAACVRIWKERRRPGFFDAEEMEAEAQWGLRLRLIAMELQRAANGGGGLRNWLCQGVLQALDVRHAALESPVDRPVREVRRR